MRKYLQELGLTPETVDKLVQVDTGDSLEELANLKRFLDAMHDRTIRVKVEGGTPGGILKNARGGAIVGPGTGTSDDILSFVPNGEHVWTADEVDKAGGQGAMYRMRAAVHQGVIPAYAGGGGVSKDPQKRYGTFQGLEKSSKLDLARQQAQIRDLEQSLKETETIGSGKNKHKRLACGAWTGRSLSRTSASPSRTEGDAGRQRGAQVVRHRRAGEAALRHCDGREGSRGRPCHSG